MEKQYIPYLVCTCTYIYMYIHTIPCMYMYTHTCTIPCMYIVPNKYSLHPFSATADLPYGCIHVLHVYVHVPACVHVYWSFAAIECTNVASARIMHFVAFGVF